VHHYFIIYYIIISLSDGLSDVVSLTCHPPSLPMIQQGSVFVPSFELTRFPCHLYPDVPPAPPPNPPRVTNRLFQNCPSDGRPHGEPRNQSALGCFQQVSQTSADRYFASPGRTVAPPAECGSGYAKSEPPSFDRHICVFSLFIASGPRRGRCPPARENYRWLPGHRHRSSPRIRPPRAVPGLGRR